MKTISLREGGKKSKEKNNQMKRSKEIFFGIFSLFSLISFE